MLSARESRGRVSTRLLPTLGVAWVIVFATSWNPSATIVPGVEGTFPPAQALAKTVTSATDFLFLDKDFLSFTGSYEVFDGFGTPVYHIQGKVVSMRHRKAILPLGGAEGQSQPLAFVQKKLVGLRKVYEIYRYEPAFEGQAATEKDDSDEPLPLYRYGWVQRKMISLPSAKYFYGLDRGDKDPTTVLEATERFNLNPFKPFMMDVTLPGETPGSATTLATIGKATNFHFRKDASWGIEVAKGMDLLGMLALAISVNQIMEDIEDERSSSHGRA